MGKELEKLAVIASLRAKRLLGQKTPLHLVGEEESEPEDQPVAATPPALPDWTTFQPIDVSPRAQKMHAIAMIANTHSWQSAITHFLMTKGVPYMSDLTDPQLDDLLDRMRGYVDAAEVGASLDDCLPAT